MRGVALAMVAAAAVVGLRVAADEPEGIPLILVPQGVSFHLIDDTRVFLDRQGSILTAFYGHSTLGNPGEPIVYCPNERAFVAPLDQSLWNERGEWVGGDAPRDLDTFKAGFGQDLVVRIDTDAVIRSKGQTGGEVSGEAGAAYSRFRAGDANAGFCLNPIPRPEVTPTPTPTPS